MAAAPSADGPATDEPAADGPAGDAPATTRQPWVLHLNDALVTVANGERVLAASPGCAVALDRDLLVGSAAFANACAYPRQMIDTFWRQCDAEALPVPGAPMRTAAEYIHAHLNEVMASAGAPAGQSVILAPPAHFDRARLALLLGIVAQCRFRAVGLIDAAVAAAAAPDMPGDCLYVEIGLHGTALSRVSAADGHLQRTADEYVTGHGWATARVQLIRALSERYVATARFDPRRHAATQQQLHNQLDALLGTAQSALPDADLDIDLNHGGRAQRATISSAQLAAPLRVAQLQLLACARRLAPRGTPVLLSQRAALMPGLVDLMATIGPVHRLPDTGIAVAALAHQRLIVHDGAALPLVRRLPAGLITAAAPAVLRVASSSGAPRHFALAGSALHPLTQDPLELTLGMPPAAGRVNLGIGPAGVFGLLVSDAGETLLLPGARAGIGINGRPAAITTRLAPGDIVSLPGAAQSIHIVELAADAP